jgi:hypothetical protein
LLVCSLTPSPLSSSEELESFFGDARESFSFLRPSILEGGFFSVILLVFDFSSSSSDELSPEDDSEDSEEHFEFPVK